MTPQILIIPFIWTLLCVSLSPPERSDFFSETRRTKLTLHVDTSGWTSFSYFVSLCCSLCVLLQGKGVSKYESRDIESSEHKEEEEVAQKEDLKIFQGGEDLTICDILDAPGEVTGKSNYGTLYKVLLQRSNKVRLLRFLKPVCTARGEELDEMIQFLGRIRHPNLVPLLGFYTGPRGQKLLVHPFYCIGMGASHNS